MVRNYELQHFLELSVVESIVTNVRIYIEKRRSDMPSKEWSRNIRIVVDI